MAGKKNRKIVKYRKPFRINIGILVFVFIFLYMLYYIYAYFTAKHISVYEVSQGTIAQNTSVEGLILRDETVYTTDSSGYVNYYCKDGSKASVGSYIYSIDETGDFYQRMSAANDGQLLLSDEGYSQLEAVTDQYLTSYSDMDFYQVYQFKYDMEGTLVEVLNSAARQELGNSPQEGGNGLHVYTANVPGVVVYHVDGLENVTVDSFTSEMFDSHSYEKENFLKRQTVSSGDAVYKLINSEIWQVVIPIDDSLAKDLSEEENIKVSFKKDHSSAWATSKILERDGGYYLVLEFQNSMIRFAMDRYVDLELLLTDTSGLKIPNTAITQKEFLLVPKDYIATDSESDNSGVFLLRENKEGEFSPVFTNVTLFYETEEFYYVDSNEIGLGDTIVHPDSKEHYVLTEREALEGVYNINRGYAVFKRIEKVFENKEYTIIKSGTSYGVSLYDHIALDSAAVNENDIVH